jgi:RNA recognition motif-containing protein
MNLYVSNISFKLTEESLRTLFEQFGQVSSAKLIADRETGRSRGVGFVEMDEESEARAAIAGLNGKEVEGRALSVDVARDKPARSSSGPRRW